MADRSYYGRNEEDEEEEEEVTEFNYKAQKDALIFAIDVSQSMLAPPPKSEDKKADRDPAVFAALKCAYQVMQQRIISSPKDMMAIILFGTQKTESAPGQNLSFHHCYLYTDLGVPAAEQVKSLKSLVEEDGDTEGILVPSQEGVKMYDLLFLANHLFVTKAPNFGSRRLFIITDNDDPHPNSKKDRDSAAQRAKDLYDLSVTVELFPVTRGDAKFDFTKFYDDIVYRDPAIEEGNSGRITESRSGDGLTLLNSLVSNINSRQTPKRAYFGNMSFELGPGLVISVKGYNIIQKQSAARSCYVWLDGEKAQIAVGETARLAEDSARTVEKAEVKKAYKFGGEFVYFTEDEQKSLRQLGEPVIRIIGFKDRSLLPFWASVKKSIYIFPSDEGYVGSTRVFAALWQKLLKSKKIGIAWHIARANGNPQLVAIIPSRSRSDEKSGANYMPAGLWLYPLPYADDMRSGPDTQTGSEAEGIIRTRDSLTDKMNLIVGNLQLPGGEYNPSKYPNPSLQWHYRILQAIALEDDVPDKPVDLTIPKHSAIHKRCGGYIEEWATVADEELGKIRDQKTIKRELDADEDESPPAKRSRTAGSKGKVESAGMKDAELRKRHKNGTISKLTVAEMRDVMTSRGLDTKGLKKDLVERLEQWVEDNV